MIGLDFDQRGIDKAIKGLDTHIIILRAATRSAVAAASADVLKDAQLLAPKNRKGRIGKSGRVYHGDPPGPIESAVTFRSFPGGPVHGRERAPSGARIRYSKPNTGARYLLSAWVGEVSTWPGSLAKRIQAETHGKFR